MKTYYLIIGLLASAISFGQDINARLDATIKKMQADEQFKHATISLYVVDSKTGKPVFDKNSEVGLAPASCLKVVTSTTAFELLGKNYRYKTELRYDGNLADGKLNGNLFITVSGDPTFGSWRWGSTKMDTVLQKISGILRSRNITAITGDLIIDDSKWETQATPGGWTWDDMGNYYGAGARGLNWHENQYDLVLRPGDNIDDPVEILGTEPRLQATMVNELKTGKKGSGDNSIIYLPEDGSIGFVRGTVEGGNKRFIVSGSMPDASASFAYAITDQLKNDHINFTGKLKAGVSYFMTKEKMPVAGEALLSFYSPPLDSITYWFLQKSVNLFGEALVKTIAYEKTKFGAKDTGINIIKNFWKDRGIESSALHMIDGSGLSPANRITTNALVTVMQYARQQDWYASFFNALPEQNGIKMKSGSIGGVRSYTGYIRSKMGAEYTFSFIINNFDGSAGAVREKMWKLLDLLK